MCGALVPSAFWSRIGELVPFEEGTWQAPQCQVVFPVQLRPQQTERNTCLYWSEVLQYPNVTVVRLRLEGKILAVRRWHRAAIMLPERIREKGPYLSG